MESGFFAKVLLNPQEQFADEAVLSHTFGALWGGFGGAMVTLVYAMALAVRGEGVSKAKLMTVSALFTLTGAALGGVVGVPVK